MQIAKILDWISFNTNLPRPAAGRYSIAGIVANAILDKAVPSFVLRDFDTKGMPPDGEFRLRGFGGFRGALEAVCPAIAAAGHVSRRSTSANLANKTTGESYQSGGEHLYLLVQDGADAKRFLYTLHDRCWLAVLGWHITGRAARLRAEARRVAEDPNYFTDMNAPPRLFGSSALPVVPGFRLRGDVVCDPLNELMPRAADSFTSRGKAKGFTRAHCAAAPVSVVSAGCGSWRPSALTLSADPLICSAVPASYRVRRIHYRMFSCVSALLVETRGVSPTISRLS
jgi:hypothetical protein